LAARPTLAISSVWPSGFARDRLGADIGVGAGTVNDHARLTEPLGEPVADEPRQQVGAAAGRERHDQLDRAWRNVAGRPVDHDQLEDGRARGVEHDERGQAEPLAEHVLAAPDGPGEQPEREVGLHVTGDARSRHQHGHQRQHRGEEERDEDQHLGGQDSKSDLADLRSTAWAVRVAKLVESPAGRTDHDQRQHEHGDQQL